MSRLQHATQGALLGGLLTIPVALLCVFFAAAGHGSYLPAKVFFPLTMLSTAVFKSITTPFIAIAIAQYPIIGAILQNAKAEGKLKMPALCIGVAHATLSLLAILFSSEFFP